jgi:hypothetical protein
MVLHKTATWRPAWPFRHQRHHHERRCTMTTTTETNLPPAQRKSGLHRDWTADGFEVRVTWKKGAARCAVCGPISGHWVVCASMRGSEIDRTCPGGSFSQGFSASGMFCDEHRAAKGTVPDLDYTRHCWHAAADLAETEHLQPVAGVCDVCSAPAISLLVRHCRDCEDPSRWLTTKCRVLSWDGSERVDTSRTHDPHLIGEWVRCAEHRDQLVAVESLAD